MFWKNNVRCTKKHIFFFLMFWKNNLSKKNALEYDLSCIIWNDGIFHSLDKEWKIIFFKKYMEIWDFPYICINITNMTLPFCQKYQRRSSPEKIHLKMIGIPVWHSRKSSRDSLYFYGDLHRFFHILLSSEKKTRKLNI